MYNSPSVSMRDKDTEPEPSGSDSPNETVVAARRGSDDDVEPAASPRAWSELAADPDAPHLGMRLHGYRLVELVGRGGWSFVYRAVHERLSLEFAVKILSDEAASPVASRRLLREARLMSSLDHPNVAKVIDFGELDNGHPFLTLELLQGDTLFDLITREAPFDVVRTASYLRQVAEGLVAAHAIGVVHRDLKPGNLMVVDRDGRQCVKILDFGVARSSRANQETQLTRQTHLLGTPLYIAPEQIRDPSAATDRADIYALGVATFRMLEGRLPFEGTPQDVLRQHIAAEAPTASGELGPLVRRMLSKEPERRPTAAELVEELDELKLGLEAPATRTVLLSDLGRPSGEPEQEVVADTKVQAAPPSTLPFAPVIMQPPSSPLIWVFGALAVIGCAAGLLSLWVALSNQRPADPPLPQETTEVVRPRASAGVVARPNPEPEPIPEEATVAPSKRPSKRAVRPPRSSPPPPVEAPARIDLKQELEAIAMTRTALRLDPKSVDLMKVFDRAQPGAMQATAAKDLLNRARTLAASADYAKKRQSSIDSRIGVLLKSGVTDELRQIEATNVKMKASRQTPPSKAWLRQLSKLEMQLRRQPGSS